MEAWLNYASDCEALPIGYQPEIGTFYDAAEPESPDFAALREEAKEPILIDFSAAVLANYKPKSIIVSKQLLRTADACLAAEGLTRYGDDEFELWNPDRSIMQPLALLLQAVFFGQIKPEEDDQIEIVPNEDFAEMCKLIKTYNTARYRPDEDYSKLANYFELEDNAITRQLFEKMASYSRKASEAHPWVIRRI